MKIALYLGSFNPFHNGHLEVVKSALNDFKIDKVVIVPTVQNPWKEEWCLYIDDRAFIIDNALFYSFPDIHYDDMYDWTENVYKQYCINQWSKYISIDLIEEKLTYPYYSYATLHALKNKYPNDEIFVLCGEDTIKDIPNWMHGEQIIKDYDFLICDRPENSISSTEIRNRVKNGEDISGLVNENIINLIKEFYK